MTKSVEKRHQREVSLGSTSLFPSFLPLLRPFSLLFLLFFCMSFSFAPCSLYLFLFGYDFLPSSFSLPFPLFICFSHVFSSFLPFSASFLSLTPTPSQSFALFLSPFFSPPSEGEFSWLPLFILPFLPLSVSPLFLPLSPGVRGSLGSSSSTCLPTRTKKGFSSFSSSPLSSHCFQKRESFWLLLYPLIFSSLSLFPLPAILLHCSSFCLIIPSFLSFYPLLPFSPFVSPLLSISLPFSF